MAPEQKTNEEELDIHVVVSSLQSTIASQALEIAKAQAMIRSRDMTIYAQSLVIEEYESRHEANTAKEGKTK